MSLDDLVGPANWSQRICRGSVAELHALTVDSAAGREVWVMQPSGVGLALGSAQKEPDALYANAQRASVAVGRRRSGGGAVLIDPTQMVWVDVVIPATDPLWVADVGEAFHWLGSAWQQALASLDVHSEVHHGTMVTNPLARQVCFASLGPGEVVDNSGRKIVGLSQRRTRLHARFQCALHRQWQPERYLELFGSDALPESSAEALNLCARDIGFSHTTILRAFSEAIAAY